jgi:hypothetical protein
MTTVTPVRRRQWPEAQSQRVAVTGDPSVHKRRVGLLARSANTNDD